MLSDAYLYSTHRSMQSHDTELLLTSVVQKMNWSQPDQDVMMDVGCGPGNSITETFLPSFPTVQKVIAIDVLPDMIEFAKLNNAHEKIEYHVANIEERRTIEQWAGQISKVVSIFCFHWLDNQTEAFRNVYRLLKYEGEAAILFGLTNPFWDSYQAHIENPKWSKYLKDANPRIPGSHYKKLGASHYRNLVKGLGFNIIVCKEEERAYGYPNDDDCKSAIFTYCGLASYIPHSLKEEFKDDLFQGFIKHSGRGSDGRPTLYYKTLTLLIKKPEA